MRTSTSWSTTSTVSIGVMLTHHHRRWFSCGLGQFPDVPDDRAELVGLVQESVGEAVGAGGAGVAGGDDHLQFGARAPHEGRKLEAIVVDQFSGMRTSVIRTSGSGVAWRTMNASSALAASITA